jgi:hypothetical protein
MSPMILQICIQITKDPHSVFTSYLVFNHLRHHHWRRLWLVTLSAFVKFVRCYFLKIFNHLILMS